MRVFFIIFISHFATNVKVDGLPCPTNRSGVTLDLDALVGTWLTVYTQPKSMDCFSLHIRATTDIERDQCVMKFGNFSESVDWSKCFLEVLSPLGKHFLQGDGFNCRELENIIIVENKEGGYELQKQRPNQWLVFGRRGDEVLVMRDVAVGAAAAFVRAPFWPTAAHLHAILHRSDVVCISRDHMQCEPHKFYQQQHMTAESAYNH